jgi:cytochrome c oxidase subunit III
MAIFTPTIPQETQNAGSNGGSALPPMSGQEIALDSFDARLRRARLGLFVGVTGIGMIFISFTSAYVVRQGLPTLDPRTGTLVHDWLSVPLPGLLFINTLVLLLSSVSMELARRNAAREAAVERNGADTGIKINDRISWLAVTVVLGLAFLSGQWAAWRELAARGFYVATSPSSSFVYLLTGVHGVHLLGGVLALLVVGIATLLRRSAESRAVWLDVTGWYWHFMAALWVYLLALLEFAR